MLTVKQAAQRLGVSPTTVYGLCQRRLLPHIRIGLGRGAVRIREEDLEEYVRGATVRPQAPALPSPPRGQFKHLRVS